MKLSLYLLIIVFIPCFCLAQTDTNKWEPSAHPAAYSFVHLSENVITDHARLDPIFEKLYQVRNAHKGVVRIIHIGDSHLQADMMSSIVRKGIQQYFGNAGRGMVFPYQLAKSNAPSDISSSSNTTWQYNRLAHPEISTRTGVSGFGIHTTQNNAYVHMQLKDIDTLTPDYFNRLLFFVGKDESCYKLTAPGIGQPMSCKTKTYSDTPSLIFNTDSLLTEFQFSKCASSNEGNFSFYGVSLERSDVPGVIYHTIGVNGAQYEQYTNNELFWEQLKALDGDLFIVSMGTNEAQNLQLNEDSFIHKCNAFLEKIYSIAPNAVVLITTPAGSYFKGKHVNIAVGTAANALLRFSKEKQLSCWDLFHISSGNAGTLQWKKNGLFSHDFVHYDAQGYQLQGQLLLNAFANSYNEYIKHRPKTKKITQSVKSKTSQQKTAKKTVQSTVKQQSIVPTATNTIYVDTPNQRKHNIIKTEGK